MKHRSGITLVEVLIAIIVMGIGLLALLTLFPVGMLRMARAIHDERSTQSAMNATTNAVVFGLGQDIDVTTDQAGTFNRIAGVPRPHDVFDNPMPHKNTPPFAAVLLQADAYSEGYPIFVDPIGFNNLQLGSASQNWVGGSFPTINAPPYNPVAPRFSHQGGLRRRSAEFLTRGIPIAPAAAFQQARNLRIFQSFTLWDELVFDGVTNPGTPQTVAGTVLRDPRFSWGYTMQRPLSSDKSVVNVSVVVFDKRSLSISGTGTLAENVYPNITYFNPINQTITIDYTNPAVVPPPIRPGDWIMDVTPYNPTATSGAAHAYWYRVVSSEDLVVGTNKYARYEVQQKIRGLTFDVNGNVIRSTFPGAFVTTPAPTNFPLGFQGTSVILDGVAEVFDKGPIRLP